MCSAHKEMYCCRLRRRHCIAIDLIAAGGIVSGGFIFEKVRDKPLDRVGGGRAKPAEGARGVGVDLCVAIKANWISG